MNKSSLSTVTETRSKLGLSEAQKRLCLVQFLDAAGIFWGRAITTPLVEAWWARIEPYTAHALQRAFAEYLDTGQFFPVPGMVIPLVKKQIGHLENKSTAK